MRYTLKILAFSPQKDKFEYLYYMGDDRYTTKLSQAVTWINTDVIEHIIEDKKIKDYKIVSVTEKELFKAVLKG